LILAAGFDFGSKALLLIVVTIAGFSLAYSGQWIVRRSFSQPLSAASTTVLSVEAVPVEATTALLALLAWAAWHLVGGVAMAYFVRSGSLDLSHNDIFISRLQTIVNQGKFGQVQEVLVEKTGDLHMFLEPEILYPGQIKGESINKKGYVGDLTDSHRIYRYNYWVNQGGQIIKTHKNLLGDANLVEQLDVNAREIISNRSISDEHYILDFTKRIAFIDTKGNETVRIYKAFNTVLAEKLGLEFFDLAGYPVNDAIELISDDFGIYAWVEIIPEVTNETSLIISQIQAYEFGQLMPIFYIILRSVEDETGHQVWYGEYIVDLMY